MLLANPHGGYHFLMGIDPYSCGVVADPGYEVVHVTLRSPLPWLEGFEKIDSHLREIGRPRHALCGVELRSPTPYSMEGFIEFNVGYCALVQSWGLYVGDLNPVARTNVAPSGSPPAIPVLHGFSFAVPTTQDAPLTFVVAGAAELREAALDEDDIIAKGESGPEAMRKKARHVVGIMESRLLGLGASWDLVTTVDVYTVFLLEGLLEDSILPKMGVADRHGLCWSRSRPPVLGLDFEMDMRGVRRELVL